MRMFVEVDIVSAFLSSTTKRMRAIAFRNGTLDSNAGRNVKRSADVWGNARHFCEVEFNFIGCEQSRSEMERWTGTSEGTWNVLRMFRETHAISAIASSTSGCEDEWSAFDPLPKLTQGSDKDVRIIIGKERESYETELNYKQHTRVSDRTQV